MRIFGIAVFLLSLPLMAFSWEIRYRVEAAGGRCEAIGQGTLSCTLSQGGEVFVGFEGENRGIVVRGLPVWASWISDPKPWRDAERALRLSPPVGKSRAALELLPRRGGGSAELILFFEVIPESPRPNGLGLVLTWDDFRGEPPPFRTEEAARIAYSLDLVYEISLVPRNDGYLASSEHADLKVSVLRERSWVHPWAKNPAVLRHEQGHLDIVEAFRGLFLMELEGISCWGRTAEEALAKLKAQVKGLFDTALGQLEKIQELYDRETAHGTDPQAQAAWEERITGWLLSPELLFSFVRKAFPEGH